MNRTEWKPDQVTFQFVREELYIQVDASRPVDIKTTVVF